MLRIMLTLGLAGLFALPSLAADPTVLPLWPGTAPGEKGNIPEEKFEADKPNEKPPLKRLGNISKPTITVIRPAKDRDTGAAVVIAPGGGYTILAWEHEGTQVAEWLNNIGVTAVLLKYRVPRRPDQPKDAPPIGALQDAQRAIRLTRSKAAEWGIDPHRIGMLGFSAGGHLTAWTSTNPGTASYDPIDDTDKISARPDFAIMIYPGGILQKGSKTQLRPEITVTKEMPPSFLVVSNNDVGSLDSTVRLAQAITEAGVSAELHVFSGGGHGYGMKPTDKPYGAWPKRCEDWLRSEGWLSAKKK